MTRNNPLRLQVLICTLGAEGLQRVAHMSMPHVDGVAYLVACQGEPVRLPEELKRDDVEVFFSPTRGLSRNRNFAFSKCSAEVALLADDDLEYTAEGLNAVLNTFEDNPEVDVATFRCDFPFEKHYPQDETSLNERIKNYYVSSYEIAVRLQAIKRSGISFCENLGIGAERFLSGEEAVFIDDALEAGLECLFFPFTIVRHRGIPTGRQLIPTPGVLMAEGVVIAKHYRLSLLPRLVLKAWRVGGNMFSNFRHLLRGARYYLRHPQEFTSLTSKKS